MTAPLTPREMVLPIEPQLFLVTNSGGIKVYHEASASTTEKIAEKFVSCHDYANLRAHAAAVTAELEEANRRAEAAERERDAVHAGELAAMEGCDDIPNDYTPNGKLAWLVGSYKTKLHAAERQLADETAIVDRIWDMFGRPSYESLGGKAIYDLIAEVQEDSRQLARYREKYGELE